MPTSPAPVDPHLDLTACDREPIHIPGAIQPHGLLLVADSDTLRVRAGAGALEAELSADWLGGDLSDLLGQDVRALIGQVTAGPGGTTPGATITGRHRRYDVAFHRAGGCVLAELEPAQDRPMTAGEVLGWLDVMAGTFERAGGLIALCEAAARAFRALTGFDRVMIYRFLDEGAGRVVAEDVAPGLSGFLHHHFPASDIPRQARALYVRNRARAIPDAAYTPAPLRPAGFETTDLSDVAVRSVSPIHLQYLQNMGVAASASISIVKDGMLWGLVACHHGEPRQLPRDVRATACTLASGLARQIRAKEEAESYRERLRLRAAEDAAMPLLNAAASLAEAVRTVSDDLRVMLDGDALALVMDHAVECFGRCPPDAESLALARWVRDRAGAEPFSTDRLMELWAPGERMRALASGVLALPLLDGRATLLWFRAEQVEEVEWAGNPHKPTADPTQPLTPRASFDTWKEAVHGRSRRWMLEELEAAHRLRRSIEDGARAREIRELNRELKRTLAEREALIAQKDVLMKEVDHRVQNSLQLVSAFLGMQAREAGPGATADRLGEAQGRLQAVALVHRRLYRDDQIRSVDLSRYLAELIGELGTTLGGDWARQIRHDLVPLLLPTDRAVSVGLVLTELVINASKYAYNGDAGPLDIAVEQHGSRFRLIVADQGRGKFGDGEGFGSRMLRAMVDKLDGEIDYANNAPGLRAVLTAPIGNASAAAR